MARLAQEMAVSIFACHSGPDVRLPIWGWVDAPGSLEILEASPCFPVFGGAQGHIRCPLQEISDAGYTFAMRRTGAQQDLRSEGRPLIFSHVI